MPENIRGGYDPMGFADLGEKSQTSLPEFCIEIRSRKYLRFASLAPGGGMVDTIYPPEQENL